MKYEPVSLPSSRLDGAVKLGDYLILIARWKDPDSTNIIFQDFVLGNKRFIPVFSSWIEFDQGCKDSIFEKEGLEIERSFLGSLLAEHEMLILNPASEHPMILNRSDLVRQE